MEESVGKGKHLKGRTRLINITRNGSVGKGKQIQQRRNCWKRENIIEI